MSKTIHTIEDVGGETWAIVASSEASALEYARGKYEVGCDDPDDEIVVKKTWEPSEEFTLGYDDGVEEPLPHPHTIDGNNVTALVKDWLDITAEGDMLGCSIF